MLLPNPLIVHNDESILFRKLFKTRKIRFYSCEDDVIIWYQMFDFVFLPLKRWFQFNSMIVRTHFASIMTLNNWEMIAEWRSYIFWWRFCCRQRCVCFPINTARPSSCLHLAKLMMGLGMGVGRNNFLIFFLFLLALPPPIPLTTLTDTNQSWRARTTRRTLKSHLPEVVAICYGSLLQWRDGSNLWKRLWHFSPSQSWRLIGSAT